MLRIIFCFFLLLSSLIEDVYAQSNNTVSVVWQTADSNLKGEPVVKSLSFKDAFL